MLTLTEMLLSLITLAVIVIASAVIVMAVQQQKGLKVMNEENTKLDEIAAFIVDPLTPYIRGLVANQKDPADAAEAQARREEEDRIFAALQGLVPAPAAPEPDTTGEAA